MKNVDDDLKEMWRRLDDRYGRPSKLADVVMYDIKRIRPVRDGDDKKVHRTCGHYLKGLS